MDIVEQLKQPIVFTFNLENIEELHIHYYKDLYVCDKWRAHILFTKDDVTSEVKLKAESYNELLAKINDFLSKL